MPQTGQRTTANARPSSSSSSSSSSTKSSSKKSGNTFSHEFGPDSPFDAGDEVRIASIDGQTTKQGTVSKDGTLKVSGLKPGIYTATADPREIDQDLVDTNAPAPQYIVPQEDRTVTFTVKDEEAARKAKYDRYGGAQPLAQESARSQR